MHKLTPHSPGRFYASLCMKLVLIHVLEHYECSMEEPQSSRFFSWRSSNVPRASTVVIFRALTDSRNLKQEV